MNRGWEAVLENFTGKMMTGQTGGFGDSYSLLMWEPFGCLGQKTQEGE